MKMTSSNQRLCVITRKKYDKSKLIKITREEKRWKLSQKDYTGRSIYILKEKEIIDKFLNLKQYKFRYFEMNDKLKEELLEYAKNL